MQKTLDIGIRKQILAFGLCISVDMGKNCLSGVEYFAVSVQTKRGTGAAAACPFLTSEKSVQNNNLHIYLSLYR